MNCICGKKIYSTSATPWLSVTTTQEGDVVSGTCVHGIYFPPKEKEGPARADPSPPAIAAVVQLPRG